MFNPHVQSLIRLALAEDLSHGDITSQLTIPEGHQSSAHIIAREQLCYCAGPILQILAAECSAPITIVAVVPDGSEVSSGAILAKLQGNTRALLSIERTALNFLQRLSGIATFYS